MTLFNLFVKHHTLQPMVRALYVQYVEQDPCGAKRDVQITNIYTRSTYTHHASRQIYTGKTA